MSTTKQLSWHEANQRYLMTALAVVRRTLERHAARPAGDKTLPEEQQSEPEQETLQTAQAALPAPAALDTLCKTFGLSPFERSLLLLAAGMELDSRFASCCAAAQSEPRHAYPTFSLALAALPDAHWSALSPSASLRRWRLIEVGSGETLLLSPLKIDERILHYLAGVSHLDERLAGMMEPVPPSDGEELVASYRAMTERLLAVWRGAGPGFEVPLVQLCGEDLAAKRMIVSAACATVRWRLCRMSGHAVPLGPGDLDMLLRLWLREAALTGSALLLECDDMDTTDPARDRAVARLIESVDSPLVVSSRERRRTGQRPTIVFHVSTPETEEQRLIWRKTLVDIESNQNGRIDGLVSQFNLSAHAIHAAYVDVRTQFQPPGHETTKTGDLVDRLWDACRRQARPRLEDLAQRIVPFAVWEDLVLPEPQQLTLREMAIHVRQRAKVYDDWGFAAKGARGLGISALFAGASGTGKTMAAEVLANELRLDLYRIDLSQVVSKYIGETEKNLRRVFDAAEEGGAILLFDEADALFGKRSEVKDSHDRYANIEVSYLLQRMEAYRGLAILTTNMKSALDQAFLRRIRFVIQFPFPDAEQRAEIWRRTFPANTPTEGLNISKLARLSMAGGNIRNIALNAAFLAAEEDQPVRMQHLLRAARSEYAKLEKPLTETESRDWV